MIRSPIAFGRKGQVEFALFTQAVQQCFALFGGTTSPYHQLFLFLHPADHIKIDHRMNMLEGNRRVFHKMFRAEQSHLFRAESDEDDAPCIAFQVGEVAGELYHCRHPRGIVIGTIVHGQGIRLARSRTRATHSKMVEVGTYHHIFLFQNRVIALQHSYDIPGLHFFL